MPRLKLSNGKTVVYPNPPGGSGWVTGSTKGASYHIYIRPASEGGGAFVDLDDNRGLVDAKTGEQTVRFNNRLWTLTEERDHIERIRALDTQ